MTEQIVQTLREIEQSKHIRILYAVESGSRAWGFASPDSDYDVRYIYVRAPEDYLRVDTLRDTIEGPLDEVMDFSGWDIRKTLELLRRSNPSLMEWVQSPIVYLTTPQWELLKKEVPQYFQPRSNMHHYLSMVLSNWHRHMQDEMVKAKKYLYVLRPLLCCRWLEQHGTVPPVPFDQLCGEVLPTELKPVMADLLYRKKQLDEKELIPHIPELDAFLKTEIPRLTEVRNAMPQEKLPDYDGLNRLFRELLQQAWA